MTKFFNGPAAGQTLMLHRTPIFLRVCEKGGKFDALDQLTDTPEPGETLTVYRVVERTGIVHLNIRGGKGGFFPIAGYQVCEEQPDQTVMRDTRLWQNWCKAEIKRRPEVPRPPGVECDVEDP